MKQNKKMSGIFILALIVFILVGYVSNQRLNNAGMETALEHNEKHLNTEYQCPMHPEIVKDKAGSCPVCGMTLIPIKENNLPTKKEILYWVAPMDSNYRRNKPGKSPMGMDLVAVYTEKNDMADGNVPVVKISAAIENNLGVRTAVVKRGSLWRKIDTVGYVTPDESKVSHIHLRVDGWVQNLAVNTEGERVKKGQRLFDLYSPELVNAMEEYLQANV